MLNEHELVLVAQANSGMIEPTKENGFTKEMMELVDKGNAELESFKKHLIKKYGEEEGKKRIAKLEVSVPFD